MNAKEEAAVQLMKLANINQDEQEFIMMKTPDLSQYGKYSTLELAMQWDRVMSDPDQDAIYTKDFACICKELSDRKQPPWEIIELHKKIMYRRVEPDFDNYA